MEFRTTCRSDTTVAPRGVSLMCLGFCVRRCSYVFFFSSRRRHTRLQGDWSSDVCSSDLLFVTTRIARTASSGEVPEDAVRAIRVVTNNYDVARGQFSGGLVASTTRSGTNTPQGSFTATLRDRTAAWGDATATPFGQGMSQTQIGGGMGGPIVRNRKFVFAALPGRC